MKPTNTFKITVASIFIIILIITFFVLDHISLDYKIYSQGLLLPHKEWVLARSNDGNFISSVKDNKKGINTSYNVTEFSRGDVVNFKLNGNLEQINYVQKGDTIGFIESNEEQRRLRELEDELDVMQSELLFFTTGQKPEDIQIAEEQLKLAKQDLETEKGLYERHLKLYNDSVLSQQEIEIYRNQLKLKEYQVLIKTAEYSSAITGEKSEQEELIRSKIKLTENQIEKIKERINNFTVVAPFSGVVMRNSNSVSDMMKLNVYDTTSVMVLAPVEIYDKSFTKLDQEVIIHTKSDRKVLNGKVVKMDNVIQKLNNRQVFFLTAQVKQNALDYMGELTEVEVITEQISALEYLRRSFNKIISK